MKWMLIAAALAAAAPRAAAESTVWQDVIEGPHPERDAYESLMARADEAVITANTRSISLPQVVHHLEIALDAYRAAIKANPRAAEPHYRIGALLHAFYFDCQAYSAAPAPATCQLTQGQSEKGLEILAAWERFEALAPLDPRVNDLLFDRAILRTKLFATVKDQKLLEGALADYQAVLDRSDGLLYRSSYLVLGNLAETHMMLGHVDDAIDRYREALRSGGSTSTLYGLAVALDRDDRGAQAMAIIRDQGFEEFEKFQVDFLESQIFFVPSGEELYYFALAHEAFGNVDAAIANWKDFIRSGAHPQFRPRAKAHLDALLAKKNQQWKPAVRERDS